MAKKYGKIFVFWPGNSAVIVVSDPVAARQVLTDSRTFIKGPDYTEKFSVVFGQGLVTSNGEQHRKDRMCLGKYFVRTNVDKHIRMIGEQSLKMMEEELEPHLGEVMDMQHYFHMLALRVFGNFALSVDYSKPENHDIARYINDLVCKGSNHMGTHIVLNIPMWSFLPSVRKLKELVSVVDAHTDMLIDERIAARARGEKGPNDALDLMLDENQSRQQLHDQLRTLLCAGHDTTAFFGCYMALLLAKHPRVQQKAKEEIKRVIGTRTDLSADDINELKYCRMIMQETLRLYSVIPFVNRTAVADTQLKDTKFTVPKGSTVLVPMCIMSRDADVWENPGEFIPERFENITGHSSAKHGYLPFGYGTRTCVGYTLALVEGTMMIALLMQKYRLQEDPTFKVQIVGGISLVSKNGVRMSVHADPI